MADFTKTIGIKKPIKLVNLSVIDVNNPEVTYLIGMRGGGKSLLKEKHVEEFWNNHITVFDAWSARDGESVFYCLNKNCEKKWDFTMKIIRRIMDYLIIEYDSRLRTNTLDERMSKLEAVVKIFHDIPKQWLSREYLKEYMDMPNDEMFDYFMNAYIDENFILYDNKSKLVTINENGIKVLLDTPLHCKCSRGYPVTLIVPDYVEFNDDELRNSPANKQYFWDYHQYEMMLKKGDVNCTIPKDVNFWKIPLPEKYQQHNLKIVHFTVPTTPQRKEIFLRQFTDIILKGREEHRIIVMNPMFFTGDEHKFKTLETMINNIELLTQHHFKPLKEEDVGKPRYKWGPTEKSWSKFAIILDEIKTIAPSSRLSGQKSSGLTKKSIYDKIGEIRHWNVWLVGSGQSTEDIFDRIRSQANKVILKRASRNLLGEGYYWVYNEIQQLRNDEFIKRGISFDTIKKGEKYIDPFIVWQVNQKVPSPDELPDNWAIVTSINNDFAYAIIEPNKFHHKHTKDHFSTDLQLSWNFVDKETGEKIQGKDLEKDTEEEKPRKSSSRQEFMERLDYMYEVQKKSFMEITEETTEKDLWENMDEQQRKKTSKNLYDKYSYWKKSNVKQEINKTFK